MKSANDIELANKAEKLQDFVEKYLVDKNGVIYSGINTDTMKPWRSEDLSEKDEFIPVGNYAPWDIINYENSGMTTGAYLAAMTYKFIAQGQKETFELARRSFKAIKHIYETGAQKEEGFFPKIYGGVFSDQTSSDQYLYSMKGMMIYLNTTPCEKERKEICHMIPRMVDYWVKREYRHDYYNIKQMQWKHARFLPFLLMAWQVSGDEKYLKEFERLNESEKIYLKAPSESRLEPCLNGTRPLTDYEKRHGSRYLTGNFSECAAMDIMGLNECLELYRKYSEYWLKSMRRAWREGKTALTADGLEYIKVLYDIKTGEAFPVMEPELIAGKDGLNWTYSRWIADIRSPKCVLLARAGVCAAGWLPEDHIMDTVNQILTKVSLEDMRWIIIEDEKNILDRHRFMSRIFSGDAIVNWLWAYWQKSVNKDRY